MQKLSYLDSNQRTATVTNNNHPRLLFSRKILNLLYRCHHMDTTTLRLCHINNIPLHIPFQASTYPVPGPPMPYSHYPWPTPKQGTCPPVPGPFTSTHMPYGYMQIPPHGYFKAPPPSFPQMNQHMAYNPNLEQHGQTQPQHRGSQFIAVPSTLPHSHQAPEVPHTQYTPQLPDDRRKCP